MGIALLGCSPAAPPQPAPPPTNEPFLLTFWCGPPLDEFDDERAAEIAAAGFNVVGAPCEGPVTQELNRSALDVAQSHGLKVWVLDRRIGQYRERDNWRSLLIPAIADYRDHPAVAGYFVIDEPTAERFEQLSDVVAQIKEEDPPRLPYINLLPDFVPPEDLGTSSYRDYVTSFVDKVRPELLSFDHYPLKTKNDRPSYFDNLATIRDVAQENDLPFMLIVQAMPHARYRDPTEAELSWQVFHGLAYGARGISYFAYWTPVDVRSAKRMKFRYGLIEGGRPTLHYFQAKRLNARVIAIAEQLAGLRSVRVGDSLGRIATRPRFGPMRGISGGAVTVGFFAGADGSPLLTLLVNRNYRFATEARLHLRHGAPLPLRFEVERKRWLPLPAATVELPPGDAVLLGWPDTAGPPGESPELPPAKTLQKSREGA